MSLAEAAAAMQGRFAGADARFAGVSTDSRGIGAGELFVAIRGERFDGHDFLAMAKERGAAGALVDARHAQAAPLPVIVVDDTRLGLGRLGRHWRARFSPVAIAIAGANGKTTTKEMLAAILRAHAGEASVLATKGNLNTDIGVPMTLLGLRAAHRYCAIELGMNHPGEIAWLAGIAQPTIAVVTNAQREHMEFMKSVAASAEENAEALRALPPDGTAVLNADDEHAAIFATAAGARRTVTFGLSPRADVSGGYALKPLSSELVLRTPSGEAHITLAIPGLHNVRNAVAAAACAHAAGVPAEAIERGLAAFRPYTGRMQAKRTRAGATLIDDSYNANPDSVRAAIDVLAGCPRPTVLVLGDMGEVGEQGPAFHREVGAYARERGIGALLALGEASREAVAAFGGGGRHFESPQALAAALPAAGTVLVKGSRFMRMERVVAALTGDAQEVH
ncbi:MAG: UDP-N-acetylmuramoyl-tripeptide--D-alanyl-D-alanine ligase [Betaproteobacteria bacterium]|nr:UDP-N-acetylmuramoyl-tripeptide--D-alanyl-D-alanine ligase [Betaproteobacteria bacterium]MDH5221578.1 UDP-N-acetylmuramoyl-tripeptide--D-alanyl-D-alanine ligase [Betaproteobacteria bacterium]MDH5350440.1 UDP-N-acetylmuramoyl-tripeptide--D-alanyl-D-alanine ligase [Betaproteobacteria bacterium]